MASVFAGLALVTVGSSRTGGGPPRWGAQLTWMIVYLTTLLCLGLLFVQQLRGMRRAWTTERFREHQDAWAQVLERERRESSEAIEMAPREAETSVPSRPPGVPTAVIPR